jgi:hypothetical protein
VQVQDPAPSPRCTAFLACRACRQSGVSKACRRSTKLVEFLLSLGLGYTAYSTDAVAEQPDASQLGWDGVPGDERQVYSRASAQYGEDCVLYEWLLRLGLSDSVMVLSVPCDDPWSPFVVCSSIPLLTILTCMLALCILTCCLPSIFVFHVSPCYDGCTLFLVLSWSRAVIFVFVSFTMSHCILRSRIYVLS